MYFKKCLFLFNPFLFQAEVQLSLGEAPPSKSTPSVQYKKKPEIKHMFQEPEKRPPLVVSTAFTVLCLVPLGALLVAVSILLDRMIRQHYFLYIHLAVFKRLLNLYVLLDKHSTPPDCFHKLRSD